MAKTNNSLTMGDISKICNVSIKTATKWFDSGILSGYRLPVSKDRRVLVEDFVHFIKENNMPLRYLKDLGVLEEKIRL